MFVLFSKQNRRFCDKDRDKLKHGSIMQSQGANKGQSCSALKLTEGLTETNRLHVYLPDNMWLATWLVLTRPHLLAVLLVLCYYIHYQGILQSTHSHVSTHTMTRDTLLLDSQVPNSFYKHASTHTRLSRASVEERKKHFKRFLSLIVRSYVNSPLINDLLVLLHRCLAEAHTELPDERKAGGLCGWLSRWTGDCCRGAG